MLLRLHCIVSSFNILSTNRNSYNYSRFQGTLKQLVPVSENESSADLSLTVTDLSKFIFIAGGQTQILGWKVVKRDKCMGDSQLLEARVQAAP